MVNCFTDATVLVVPRRRGRAGIGTCAPRPHVRALRMSSASAPQPAAPASTREPVHDRLVRLERALATAVTQERYSDAAELRDALAALRGADPLLSLRDELAAAVAAEDFAAAARARDALAVLTERRARAPGRRANRLLLLRGRANPANALRVATVSPTGTIPLELLPDPGAKTSEPPRVFLQPTWSPTADYVAFTEVLFRVENVQGMRAVSIADSECRVVVMNALDGEIVKAVEVRKPPFFYSWSPCGKTLTFLANDPDSSSPRVALSAIRVVAPAGGASDDLDLIFGPIASAHPLLYDFCPRDSTRVVAHLGNINTVAVMPVASGATSRNLTCQAGSFGAPQWHPLQGETGREVVLFVEAVPLNETPKIKDDSTNTGVAGMRSIFTVSDKEDTKARNSNTFDSILGNGSNMIENLFRQGARKLGFKDSPSSTPSSTPTPKDDKKRSSSSEEDDKRSALEEKIAELEAELGGELGERIAGGLRKLLPEKDTWIDSNDESRSSNEPKPLQQLVMCDANDPSLKQVLTRFTGVMAFKLSPDGQKLATMITDPDTGHDELVLTAGDYSPDSVVPKDPPAHRWRKDKQDKIGNADVILSTPKSRVLAFFWSPDSRILLFLSSIKGSRCGAAQWATFDTVTNRVTRYERIVPSGIYVHCLNFFDQFADAMTPWSPDSESFCYPGRRLTQAEKERDENAPASSPSSPLLAALLLHRENNGESKGFAAWVQKLPNDGEDTPEPSNVVDNVEFASWSPC